MSQTIDLSDHRKEFGLTQDQISDRVKISQTHVSRLVNASKAKRKTVKLCLHPDGDIEIIHHRRIGERG